VSCPVCGSRRARRSCPALKEQICTVCCGTKRLVEIACPSDCVYLAAAREHPAAATLRQQEHDLRFLAQLMRDLSERQSQVLFLLATLLLRYNPPELQALIDDDIAEAAGALAGTFETASRGVIYEHQPASLPAARLATSLKALLAEAGKGAPSSFERDAAVVLRRLEESARSLHAVDGSNRRRFLDLLGRIIRRPDGDRGGDDRAAPEPSRLIVP
jgi:hypothetical protein